MLHNRQVTVGQCVQAGHVCTLSAQGSLNCAGGVGDPLLEEAMLIMSLKNK